MTAPLAVDGLVELDYRPQSRPLARDLAPSATVDVRSTGDGPRLQSWRDHVLYVDRFGAASAGEDPPGGDGAGVVAVSPGVGSGPLVLATDGTVSRWQPSGPGPVLWRADAATDPRMLSVEEVAPDRLLVRRYAERATEIVALPAGTTVARRDGVPDVVLALPGRVVEANFLTEPQLRCARPDRYETVWERSTGTNGRVLAAAGGRVWAGLDGNRLVAFDQDDGREVMGREARDLTVHRSGHHRRPPGAVHRLRDPRA